MRVLVVANVASGRGRAAERRVRCERELAAAGLDPQPISLDSDAGTWRDACRAARAVVAVGGDGTVRSVAARLRGTGVPLAIVPTGTENLAAREFGFLKPRVPLAAAVLQGSVRRCDLGILRRRGEADHVFVVMASAGLDAEVVADLAAHRDGPITHGSYLGPILRECRSWQPPTVDAVGAGGAGLRGRGQLVMANARQYAMRLDPARRADPCDGALDLALLPARGWLAMVGWAIRLACSSGGVPGGIRQARSPSWRITFDRPVRLQADGDPVPGAPCAQVEGFADPGALVLVDVGPP